jgi:hypothetical protein
VPPKQFLCRSKAVTAHLAAEMALSVLAYNLTGVMNIVGIKPLTPRLWRAAASPDWIDTFRAGFYTTKRLRMVGYSAIAAGRVRPRSTGLIRLSKFLL